MSDEPILFTAEAGDVEHQQVIEIVEMLREITAPLITEADDMLMAQSMLMTALAIYAGTIFGGLIFIGVAKDQDRRRTTDSVARNFRSGIEVGKQRATRIARNIDPTKN